MRAARPGLVIMVFISAATLIGCFGSQDNTNIAANSEIQNRAANTHSGATYSGKIVYPPQIADDFVKGCEGQGAKPELCKCVFEKIQQRYSYEEFQAIGSEINAGHPPDHFIEFSDRARVECLK